MMAVSRWACLAAFGLAGVACSLGAPQTPQTRLERRASIARPAAEGIHGRPDRLTPGAVDVDREAAPSVRVGSSAAGPVASSAAPWERALESGPRARRTPVRHREGEAAGLYYLETVVGAVPIDAALPLVVALHGLGDRPQPLDGPFFDTPDPVRVVQPRAPTPMGEGYTWLPVRVSEGRVGLLSRSAAAAAERLAAFVDSVRAQRPSRGRTVVTGFSQGGILAFVLATQHPDVVGESIPLAGWLPPGLWPSELPSSPPPIRTMHGVADRVVPLGPTRRAVSHLGRLGFHVELVEIPGVGHQRSPEMDLLLARWLADAVRRQWGGSTSAALAEPVPVLDWQPPMRAKSSKAPGRFGTRVEP